jgi:hypothetical protein
MLRRIASAVTCWYNRQKYRGKLTLKIHDERVEVFRSNGTILDSFRWDEIIKIQTFKADCLAYDMICLRFSTTKQSFVFNEDTTGFVILMKSMSQRYPDIPEEWYFEVMQPPFETNQRTLWKRDV